MKAETNVGIKIMKNNRESLDMPNTHSRRRVIANNWLKKSALVAKNREKYVFLARRVPFPAPAISRCINDSAGSSATMCCGVPTIMPHVMSGLAPSAPGAIAGVPGSVKPLILGVPLPPSKPALPPPPPPTIESKLDTPMRAPLGSAWLLLRPP